MPNKMHIKVGAVALLIIFVSLGFSQKPVQRPKVHSDFAFGSYPTSREATSLMSKDKNRFMVVAFHEGWDFDKIGKELKIQDEEVDKLFSDLDAEHLVSQNQDNDARPIMTVIREKDLERIKGSLQKNSEELARIVEGNWSQIETMAASLKGASGVPREQLMYEIVASGILLGAMNETFYEDKTLVPPGPKRGRGQRYFAWLAEGDPRYAGHIQREETPSGVNTIVTVGATLPEARPSLDEIQASHGMILDEAESRRFRSFVTVFCKDKLLPYFKTNRDALIKVASQMSASRYSAFGEFLAWYYNQMANNTVDEIVAARRMQPPAGQYAYAIKSLQ
jgi:hypothetical protein